MNKEELFHLLAFKISNGEITRDDVINRFNLAPPPAPVAPTVSTTTIAPSQRSFSVTKMLYVLGAAIVVIGIVIFVGQIWEDIGSIGRVGVTLGLGLLITAIGSMLLKSKPGESIGSVFHAIGGLLVPSGAMVTLAELSTGQDPIWPVTITFAVVFLFYMLLNSVHKTAVLTLFSIANGTTVVYLFVHAMLSESYYVEWDVYAYLTMVIGLSYILLAYSFRDGWNAKLSGVLNFFGSAMFLASAFSRVFDSVPWQMAYFLIVIGGLFLSAYVRSRGVLFVSTIFLIAHVSYITSEYFADSVGWPISLVILGFVFIGLAYMSININKKYIT